MRLKTTAPVNTLKDKDMKWTALPIVANTIRSADKVDTMASDMDFDTMYSTGRRGDMLQKLCRPSPFSSSHIPNEKYTQHCGIGQNDKGRSDVFVLCRSYHQCNDVNHTDKGIQKIKAIFYLKTNIVFQTAYESHCSLLPVNAINISSSVCSFEWILVRVPFFSAD